MKNNILSLFLCLFTLNAVSQISYQPFYDETSFNAKVVDVSNITKPVGATIGTAAVNNTGASTYTIPIWCPPGSNNFVPRIAMHYNSQTGNGIMGMGWSLSGLSSITRVNKDIYHDGETAPIEVSSNDYFALDGIRMVGKLGQYGGANSIYTLEAEDFSNIVSYHTNGSLHWFSVRKRDGTEMEYGRTTDSRLIANQGIGTVIWQLNRIIDPNGNYIDFEYDYDHNFGRTQVLKKIKYTGNIHLSMQPYNTIEFIYGNNRTDLTPIFEAGQLVNYSHLLKQIKVVDENNIVRKVYELSYATDNINSYFKELKELNNNGQNLNTTIFKYGDLKPSLTEIDAVNLNRPYALGNSFCSDFDGDGISEIVNLGYNSDFQIFKKDLQGHYNKIYEVNSWNGNGTNIGNGVYVLPIESQRHNFLNVTDFDGDGLTDLVRVNSNNQVVSNIQIILGDKNNVLKRQNNHPTGLLDPINITPTSTWNNVNFGSCEISPQDHPSQVSGDFDGDKKTEIIVFFEKSGNHYPCIFSNNQSQASVIGIDFNSINDEYDLKVFDFDGDGKDELCFLDGSGCYIYKFSMQGNGNYHAVLIPATGINRTGGSLFPSNHNQVHLGDFNGDGKTDVFGKDNNGNWKIGISTGKQWVYSNFSFQSNPIPFEFVIVADYNGDGKSDIFHAVDNGSKKRNIYYSRGYTFYLDEIAGSWDADYMYTGDLNGDGKADILANYGVGVGNNPFKIYYFRENGRENLLEKIADGYGNIISFGYEPLTTGLNYAKGSSAQYPLLDIKLPLNVVRVFQTPTASGMSSAYYTYEEGIANMSGRGFLGFKKVITEVSSTNTKTETVSDINTTYYSPYVKEIKSFNTTTNQQLTHTINNIHFSPGSVTGTFYQQLLSQTEQNLLTGATTTTTNTYDNNNFGTIVSSTTDVNGIESITTATTYVQPGYTTIPCMPDVVTVTRQRNGQAAATDKTKYLYWPNGLVHQKIEKYQTVANITYTYTYDGFGNMIQHDQFNIAISGGNPHTLTNTYSYNDGKGRFPTSSANPLSQTTSTTWDPVWGKPLTVTGIDGVITTNTYNSWGKLTSTKLKTGTMDEETITYSDGWGPGGNTFYTLVSHPDKPDVKTWYDKLGREIQTETEHHNGQWTVSTKTYDAKGNLLTETAPKLSSEPSFTTTYAHNDPYNRLTSVTNNFGTTNYSYSFLGNGEVEATVTNPAGQSKKTITDATGKTIQEEDHGGKLYYSYDSRGNLLTVKHWLHTLLTHTYNNLGMKTHTYDISAGLTTYSYDAFGRLKSEKDANNHQHTFKYNALGLVTERWGPEGTTYYTYNETGPGAANQLLSVTGFNGVNENYIYDDLGRLTHKEKLIDGDVYTTDYTYDYTDDVHTATYGNGFSLLYGYDNGFLTNVYKPSGIMTLGLPMYEGIFTANQYNGLGQCTQHTVGNGLTTTKTYHHGYLTHILAPGVQDLAVSYDYTTGNLLAREDQIKGLKEDFTYDNLNRLTQSVVQNTGNLSMLPAQTVTYDATANGTSRGNIITKTDVGSLAMNPRGATPSAKNENSLISQNTQDISYTPFRKTQSVKEIDPATGDEYEQIFTYDASYNRVKTELWNNNQGILLNTRLYLDGYEVNIDPNTNSKTYIHYLAGSDGLFALAEVQNQYYANQDNATYHYIYQDHLGSIVAATDENGTVEVEQNFDAWGRERDPGTWDYAGAVKVGTDPSYPWLYRGYTGHEHMPHFSIINMNGRMYDPVLGRMMSPDIYVHGGTQGYNRYSYVMNNPLRYTDPNGQIPVNVVSGIVGAVIGGAINVAVHWKDINQGGKFNWGKAGMAFGIGAAGGFVAGFTFGAAGGAAAGATSAFALANTYAVAGAYSYMISQPITSYGNHVAFGDPLPTEKEYMIGLGTSVALSWTGGLIQGKLLGLPWTNQPGPAKDYISPIAGREVQQIGGDDVGQIELKGQVSDDFFEGTKYSTKVVKQMQQNNGVNNHNFPESVKAFQSDGVIKSIEGGDNVVRQSLLIEGNYNGKHGWFEFIKEADGSINHRFFETRPTNWLINK